MKYLVCITLLAFVGVVLSGTRGHSRGCIYINGKCHRECEEGTHAYVTGCSYMTPEATCDEPNPQEDRRGRICDFTACYCDPPTVRDPETRKCIPLVECKKKN